MEKIIFGICLLLHTTFLYALPTAKATVLVKDESGMHLSQVDAGLGFSVPKKEGWGSTSSGTRGLTDDEGRFTATGETEQILRYGARGESYYSSHYEFRKLTDITGIIGFRRWQPWNPTLEVVLKKIKNPTAMYVYATGYIDLPKVGEPIGYDLVKHDWLVPYGKGLTADFIFNVSSIKKASDDYKIELIVNFSNELDGIQDFETSSGLGSVLISAHNAPADGYQNSFYNKWEKTPGQRASAPFKDGRNHYFRVRCSEDEESCLYGKIYDNITFGSTATKFTYYLNPTAGDRNVEFDPKKTCLSYAEAMKLNSLNLA